MLRKNISQKRFNTAGARIPMSRKLPSDFFKPNDLCDSRQLKQLRKLTPSSKKGIQNSQHNFKSIIYNRDPLQFTFRRSSSEQYCSLHQRIGPKRYLMHKGQKENLKQTMKLPPIINFTLLRETNQSAKKFVTKLTKKNSKKISEQLRQNRQKQNAEL